MQPRRRKKARKVGGTGKVSIRGKNHRTRIHQHEDNPKRKNFHRREGQGKRESLATG